MKEAIPSASELVRRFRAEHHARKSLGQHFLLDPNVLDRIAAAATAGPFPVFEIGPGPGTLTQALLHRGVGVTAIEKDRRAVAFLQRTLAGDHPLSVQEGDILETSLPASPKPWSVTGNLPYNVATEVFFRCVDWRADIARMVFMFQREVARRFVAEPGSKKWGILGVVAQYHFETSWLGEVAPGAFQPAPRVHSGIVVFDPIEPRLPDELEPVLRRVVRTAFGQRRKTIANSLSGIFGLAKDDVVSALEAVGIEPRRRPERLPVDAFCELTRALSERRT